MLEHVSPTHRRERRARSRYAAPWCAVLLISGCVVAGVAPPVAAAQEEPQEEAAEKAMPEADPDPWQPLRLLEGTWQGAIDGILGQGEGRRRYEFILDGRYLVSRHASVRLPQEKSPEGDYHRDMAVFSYDRGRGSIVQREFMVEGYVIRSECQVEPKRFVCTSEDVENGSGIRARLTVEIADRYRFQEVYELAFPGREMKLYFTIQWTRIPDLAD